MKPEKIECPCCRRSLFRPNVSITTVFWSDDCACSDEETCAFHRSAPVTRPKRPPENVMEDRRRALEAIVQLRWDEQKRRAEVCRKAVVADATDFLSQQAQEDGFYGPDPDDAA